MNQRKMRMHYSSRILLACVLVKIGTAGAVSAITGNFVAPIVREMNSQVSEFTMLMSINAIAMALLYIPASRLLTTKRIGIVMGLASIGEVVGIALMSTYKTVHMFYFSGALIGGCQAFTGFVAIPIVVNMWFKRRTGTVLGIIIAAGSAATIGYGLLSAQLISHFGWRSAYLILAGMALVITVPAVFLIIKSPEEAGTAPYGASAEPKGSLASPGFAEEWSLTRKQAFRLPLLYVGWLACILFSYGSGVAFYITPFTTMELGQSIEFGALAGMFLSFGGILCSLILGVINDKFGVRAGMLWGAVTTTAGYLLMMLSYKNPVNSYYASFVVGLGMSMYTVQCPLLARSIVGSQHFSNIWPTMMIANSLIGGGLFSTIGLFYDRLGSYKGAFIMASVLFVLAFLVGSVATKRAESLKTQATTI